MDEKQQLRQGRISIIDIILFCLQNWRWIVVGMVTAAIVMGGYKYQSTVREKQIKNIPQQEQDEEPESEIENNFGEQAVEFHEQAIRELEHDLEVKEDYLENSVVMQMDPNHVFIGTLSYYVKDAELGSRLVAAYSAFVSGGKMAETLVEKDNSVPAEDLQFLISFLGSGNNIYKIDGSNQVILSAESEEAVFQVKIRMRDRNQGILYLKYAEEIIEKYSIQLQSEIEEHKLILLSSALSEVADAEIQEYQSTKRSAYATSAKNLQGLRTDLITIQSMQDSSSLEETEEENVIIVNPISAAVKYAALGLILGAGIVCFVLLIIYILGEKLQDTEEFDIEFGMPLLGIIRISEMKKKLFGFIDTIVFRLRGSVFARISLEEQIKMTVVNIQTVISKNTEKVQKIMLAGTIAEKDAEQLRTWLISEMGSVSFSSYKQIVFQSTAIKELENYDGVLFLEKKGVSNLRFIAQEKKLAEDRGVAVLGTIVLT